MRRSSVSVLLAAAVVAAPLAAAPASAAAGRAKVPNVVGLNHQYAQDFLQNKGFYLLEERDATGRKRLLLWDRNWVVVRQSPAAGTAVNPDRTPVTLYAEKIGE